MGIVVGVPIVGVPIPTITDPVGVIERLRTGQKVSQYPLTDSGRS